MTSIASGPKTFPPSHVYPRNLPFTSPFLCVVLQLDPTKLGESVVTQKKKKKKKRGSVCTY